MNHYEVTIVHYQTPNIDDRNLVPTICVLRKLTNWRLLVAKIFMDELYAETSWRTERTFLVTAEQLGNAYAEKVKQDADEKGIDFDFLYIRKLTLPHNTYDVREL